VLKIKAMAKINLALDVVRKREDGYHDIKTIMQAITLHDLITLKPIDENIIRICTDNPRIPTDEKNLCYKAAKLLKDQFKINSGVEILIEKRIPIEAGLGGGSSDAAATLWGLTRLWNINLPFNRVLLLGQQIGSDVPFLLTGGTVYATGRGEILSRLSPLKGVYFVIVKPDISVSTKEVYQSLNLNFIDRRHSIGDLLNHYLNKDIVKFSKNIFNVLESVTAKKYPEILEIKRKMIEKGALGSLMSGSGSSVFGIFGSYEGAENALEYFRLDYRDVFIAEPTCKSLEII